MTKLSMAVMRNERLWPSAFARHLAARFRQSAAQPRDLLPFLRLNWPEVIEPAWPRAL